MESRGLAISTDFDLSRASAGLERPDLEAELQALRKLIKDPEGTSSPFMVNAVRGNVLTLQHPRSSCPSPSYPWRNGLASSLPAQAAHPPT